jgi:beta-phosphoglucomutase-like phosphatase (HAD superfamily)
MTIVLRREEFDGLIFDCDGTLVDTAPSHLAALRLALERVGLAIDDEWYFKRVGLGPDDLLDDYENHYSPLPMSRPEFLAPYAEAFQQGLAELREVEIVASLAREWHGQVPMSVASNGQGANVRATLGSVGLLSLFDYVVAIEDVARGKPAPDIFLEAARRMGVPAERCVVLEDSDEGLEGARRAGTHVIDVRTLWTPSWKETTNAGEGS